MPEKRNHAPLLFLQHIARTLSQDKAAMLMQEEHILMHKK